MRKKLKPDVHLEFCEEGCTAESTVPPFGVGYNEPAPTNLEQTGEVIVLGENDAIIEIDGVRCRIRRAGPPKGSSGRREG